MTPMDAAIAWSTTPCLSHRDQRVVGLSSSLKTPRGFDFKEYKTTTRQDSRGSLVIHRLGRELAQRAQYNSDAPNHGFIYFLVRMRTWSVDAYQAPDFNIAGPTKELYKTFGVEKVKGYSDDFTQHETDVLPKATWSVVATAWDLAKGDEAKRVSRGFHVGFTYIR